MGTRRKFGVRQATVRPESIMLFKLPIMLLSISPKIYLLCSILCSIMPNYAPLIVRN